MGKTANVEPAQDSDTDINITPMLDVVFIMLIFFIVTASFVKKAGIDVNCPDSSVSPPTGQGCILISISENNEIWMGRRLVDPRAVRANSESISVQNPGATVVVQADRSSANNTLVQVMTASREAGIYKIALAASRNK